MDADAPQSLGGGGPTPGITWTLIGRSSSRSVPGETTTSPSGFSRSLATFAMNLLVPAHARGQAVGDLPYLLAQHRGEAGDGRLLEVRQVRVLGRREIDERLIQGERLDQRVMPRSSPITAWLASR